MEQFSHIGGHRAVDLVNTVHWRLDPVRRTDRLTSLGDVLAWSRQMDLLTGAEAERLQEESRRHRGTAAAEHRRTVRLRESLYAALIDDEDQAADIVAGEYREAIERSRLTRRPDDGWTWTEDSFGLHTPRHRLSRSVVDLLSSAASAQVRQCHDDACGWIFLDLSPRGNRRWCVSADCGNRNRVRRHYQRRGDQHADGRSAPT
ncbi:MAG TPA: CGNR zinc finger domain-containing protein [Mycobacteriales bacterium]|nr:CGNR zinc finger domain-containing protein [Mycobacteriales bacterium]